MEKAAIGDERRSEADRNAAADEISSCEYRHGSRYICTDFRFQASAAQRVFDLPELLEAILLQVSDECRPAKVPKSPGFAAPVCKYFVLQRVNKSFQAIIERNKTIQRRMFLLPYPAETSGVKAHNSVAWLRDDIGISHQGTRLSDLCGDLSFVTMWHMDTEPEGCRPFHSNGEESWRKIRVHGIKGGPPINFSYQHGRLGSIPGDPEVTLGELHDGMQSLIPLMVKYKQAHLEHWYAWHRMDDNAERVAKRERRLERAANRIMKAVALLSLFQ